MVTGTSLAFALVRVRHGDPCPSPQKFQEALAEDRRQLHLPHPNGPAELETAGPYRIMVDGTEMDEYVVRER